MQSLGPVCKPATEAISRPTLLPEKNRTGALNEQGAQVAVATPADAAEDCPVAGRIEAAAACHVSPAACRDPWHPDTPSLV
jgi:hypothetical protein